MSWGDQEDHERVKNMFKCKIGAFLMDYFEISMANMKFWALDFYFLMTKIKKRWATGNMYQQKVGRC